MQKELGVWEFRGLYNIFAIEDTLNCSSVITWQLGRERPLLFQFMLERPIRSHPVEAR